MGDMADFYVSLDGPEDELDREDGYNLLPEYKIDTCPRCNSKLVQRKNKTTGEFFMGCSGFPKCKFSTKVNNYVKFR